MKSPYLVDIFAEYETRKERERLQDRPHLASNELCGNCAGRIGDQEYRVNADGICFHRSCDLQMQAEGDMEAAARYRKLAANCTGYHRRWWTKRAEESQLAARDKLTEAYRLYAGEIRCNCCDYGKWDVEIAGRGIAHAICCEVEGLS
jgi:hypothetical protein